MTTDPVENAETPPLKKSAQYDWKILAFGQGLSCILAAMWVSQSTIYLKCEWNSPAFSCTWAFLMLSFNLVPLIRKGRSIRMGQDKSSPTPAHWFLWVIPLQTSPWAYLGMATLSFYGFFISISAIRYTTVTSISIFDAMAIPTAMILSHAFLRRRYNRLHYLGATLCLSGLFLTAFVDVLSNKAYQQATTTNTQARIRNDGSKEYPHKLVGDIMAFMGGIFFGTNDVLAEFTVRRHQAGSTEYLGMIGLFAFIISIIQASITERKQIAALFQGDTSCADSAMGGLLILFIAGQLGRIGGLAKFLSLADAALLQLSLLTSDLYTAIFSMVYQGIVPRAFFWVAMVLVVTGIVVYECGKIPIVEEFKNADQMDGIMKVEGHNESEANAGEVASVKADDDEMPTYA